MAVLLTMGAGLYFWKIHGKKKETEAGTGRWHSSFRPTPPLTHLASFVPLSLSPCTGVGGVAMALASMVVGVCRVLRLRVELYFVCDSGTGLEDGRRVREDDICYAELSQQESQEGGDKVRAGSCATWAPRSLCPTWACEAQSPALSGSSAPLNSSWRVDSLSERVYSRTSVVLGPGESLPRHVSSTASTHAPGDPSAAPGTPCVTLLGRL